MHCFGDHRALVLIDTICVSDDVINIPLQGPFERIIRFGSRPSPLRRNALLIEENSHMRKVLFATFLTLLGIMLVLVPASNLLAQRLTGSASVEILDPSGAAVPDARATVASRDRGISLELKSGADGVVRRSSDSGLGPR